MYDYEYLETLADGAEKMEYLKKCIAEADAEQDMEHALHLRHDYIEQSVFHDDGFKGLLMFPELMKLFDENPGIMDPVSFMFVFKWIIDRTDEYYQITLEQIDEYFKRFRDYIEQFGYTLRTYYKEQFSVYSSIDPDPQSMLDLMELSEKYERTAMSDCETCELSERINCELRYGSFEKGMELLREMIERGMRCAEQPQYTYGTVAGILAEKGMYDEAQHYASLFLPRVEGDELNALRNIAEVIKLYSMCDLNQAYELFRRTVHLFSETKSPSDRFRYADAARRFFEKLVESDQESIHTNLNSSFEWYNGEGLYNCEEMYEKFKAVEEDLAEKFNARNKTDYYTQLMEFEYPDAPTIELKLPAHGRIPNQRTGIAIPFKTSDDFPSPEQIEQALNSIGEFENVSVAVDAESGLLYAGGRDEDGKAFNYIIAFDDMHGFDGFEQPHYFGEHAGEVIKDYTVAMVVMTTFDDNFVGMRRLIKFVNALNTGGSPLIIDLSSSRLLSSKWAEIEASGTSAPLEKYFYRIAVFRSAFEEEKLDVTTEGLPQSGSINLLVPAVDEEELDYVRDMVRQIAINAVSVDPLPDEGIWFNAGFAYDNKEFLRVKWRPITLPSDDEEAETEIFAEPVLRFPDGTEYTIPEIPEEEREKIDLRQTNRLSFIREAKARATFPAACEFLKRNADSFGMVAGAEFTVYDEDEEDDEGYDEIIYLEILPDGTAEVLSDDFDEEGKRKGDKYDLDPSRIFTWQLQVGEDGRFGYDDLYFLLIKEQELENSEAEEEE